MSAWTNNFSHVEYIFNIASLVSDSIPIIEFKFNSGFN